MLQEQEQRHIYYDRDLDIEAYNLSGIVQKFPNHFHEYYVIGFVEGGKRHLWCKGKEYDVSEGDLLLFNPRDNHYCGPINGEILDCRAVNINPEEMERTVGEITGKPYMPYFTDTVVYFTDIQILDSAKVSKEGFLAHRELYSYQLKNYLEDNQLQQNSTCMIYFSENRKKLEKEATKILNKYKKNNRMTVSRIDSDKFRFTKPEE